MRAVNRRKGDQEESRTKQNDLQDAASDHPGFNIKSEKTKQTGAVRLRATELPEKLFSDLKIGSNRNINRNIDINSTSNTNTKSSGTVFPKEQ